LKFTKRKITGHSGYFDICDACSVTYVVDVPVKMNGTLVFPSTGTDLLRLKLSGIAIV
jgi:hypothetical protein